MKKEKIWMTEQGSKYRMDDTTIIKKDEYKISSYDYTVQRYMEKNHLFSTEK